MLKKMVISSMYIQVFSLEVSSSFWFPTNLNCVSELLIFSSVHDALWQQKHKQNSEKQKKKGGWRSYSHSITFRQLQ